MNSNSGGRWNIPLAAAVAFVSSPKHSLDMAPILVEPLSEKAYELLRQLEALHILRVVTPASAPERKPSIANLVGSLSKETAEQMRIETTQMRNEWEREF